MNRRLLAGLVLVLAVSVTAGVGGYSSVNASRSVDVAVVPDDEAYLGVVPAAFDRCGNQSFVTLYNRLGGGVSLAIDVRVVATEGGLEASVTTQPTAISSGGSDVVEGRIRPTDGERGDESFTLAIDAESDGVSLALRRTYSVACVEAESTTTPG